jgi:carbonic anhydrase
MSRTLDHLLRRNAEWATQRTRDDPGFFSRLVGQQAPTYLWIGCSDSRVPANSLL